MSSYVQILQEQNYIMQIISIFCKDFFSNYVMYYFKYTNIDRL